MLSTAKTGEPRAGVLSLWRVLLAQIDNGDSKDVEEAERRLELMSHWRDPLEAQKIQRCHRRSLIDDNPSSG
jgi:hypothetical protein